MPEEQSENRYCSVSIHCADCTYRKTPDEQASCRSARLRYLTEEEQDAAIAASTTGIDPNMLKKLSNETKKLFVWDFLCAHQDAKSYAGGRADGRKALIEWLREPCKEHCTYAAYPSGVEYGLRKDCDVCWAELQEGK